MLTSIEQEEKVKASVNTTVRSEGEKQEVSSLTGTNLQEKEKSLRQRKMLSYLGSRNVYKSYKRS